MSRTNNSIRNIKYAIIGQVLGVSISLINRLVFVRILSAEYLGINGIFANILSMLSLAELGIGSAIVYSMYNPLAEKDEYKLKALLSLYRKAYVVVGIFIAVVGVIITPFLDFFIKDMPNILNIQVIYLIFVTNSSISYFFSYKRSLMIADQKRYIASFYRYSFYIILNIGQIIILFLTRKYILYISIQIASTLFENICVSKKADHLYPFLKKIDNVKLDNDEKRTILKNVRAMLFHRIGSIIVLGTDNLLISKFIGVVAVGLYSNYLLIISALNTAFGLVFESLTASIGNLGVTETNDKKKIVFETIDLIGFWLFGFASICLVNLFNPFIKILVGEEYLFPMPIVLLIVLNFYLTGRRRSVITFRDAFGLFWYDRYKPLLEVVINLITSIIIAKMIGIAGVFIGTTISTLTTCFWIEPYVLYKYGFKCSVKQYFKRYNMHASLLLVASLITYLICNLFSNIGFLAFLGKLLVCTVVPNLLFLMFFKRTDELKYLLKILRSRFSNKSSKFLSSFIRILIK